MIAQLALDFTAPARRSGTYYVTTLLTDAQLLEAVAAAEHQEQVVLAMFQHKGLLTPSRAHKLYVLFTGKRDTPLTSIRRAVSTLAKDGKLVKTDSQRVGAYGKPEHVWGLAHG